MGPDRHPSESRERERRTKWAGQIHRQSGQTKLAVKMGRQKLAAKMGRRNNLYLTDNSFKCFLKSEINKKRKIYDSKTRNHKDRERERGGEGGGEREEEIAFLRVLERHFIFFCRLKSGKVHHLRVKSSKI